MSAVIPKRPIPPPDNPDIGGHIVMTPAPEVSEWVINEILDGDGNIFNPDHSHLIDADLVFMWASQSYEKAGRTVLGQCEKVMIRVSAWQKARQEQQLYQWFGRVPEFIITLSAEHCAECSDEEFCALVEHELYHIAHAVDEFGATKFDKETGMPMLKLRGHDVEEFVGVVRRYGAAADVQAMIDAAERPPEVAKLNIARACGTCMLKAV